jgi:hypothetical protein
MAVNDKEIVGQEISVTERAKLYPISRRMCLYFVDYMKD